MRKCSQSTSGYMCELTKIDRNVIFNIECLGYCFKQGIVSKVLSSDTLVLGQKPDAKSLFLFLRQAGS
jgi:hypothetical protein